MDIREILFKQSRDFEKKPALIFKDRQISFDDLYRYVRKLACVLRENSISKGDKVAFYLPNCCEYVYSYLACFCLGAVGVPLDFMLKKDELVSCLSHSETKLLIASGRPDVDLREIQKQVPSLKKVLLFENLDGMMAAADEYDERVVIDDSDPALIMYTSGTTGKPKGILLNYRHLDGPPKAMHHFVDLTDKDVKLAAIPFSHIGGFIYIQNCVLFGITLVIMDRFNPIRFLKNIEACKVTCFHIVPPMYNAILSLKQIEKFDLSSLRWVVVFGAPSSPEVMERFHKYCPNAKLLNGWGMTETCPPNTVTPMDSDNIASVGKPAPHCDIKILDESGNEVKPGDVGEIVIDGWIVMQEYYKDPELTAEVKGPQGLRTGDLGRFDENGFLYIVGRKKEMIKVGGQIVFEPEVESVLYKHEKVAEVAVIGIPEEIKGEVVKAFVVLKKGSDIAPEELRYFAREHLANFKVPAQVDICEELPKNRTGKIDKALLRKG